MHGSRSTTGHSLRICQHAIDGQDYGLLGIPLIWVSHDIDRGANLLAKKPHLIDRLIRANSAEFRGTIGSNRNQCDTCVGRFNDGRREVGHRASARADNRNRAAGDLR